MKAYLIDPEHMAVSAVDYDGDYRNIYKLIGAECFDVARINEDGDGIFVDDEGLLRSGVQPAFQTSLYHSPLVGKGLVLGTDAEGNSISPKITMAELASTLSFGVLTLGE